MLVRKDKKEGELLVRVSEDNISEMLGKLKKIKSEVLKYHKIKPTECKWDKPTEDEIIINENNNQQTSLKTLSKPEITITPATDEFKKLKNTVEDLRDAVDTINKKRLKESIQEEREVFNDVIK